MTLFLLALFVIFSGGILTLVPGRGPRKESVLHAGTISAGCVLALVPVMQVLLGGELSSLRIPWAIPMGQIALAIDPLSAVFLFLHFAVSGASAVFGFSYFRHDEGKRSLKSLHLFFSVFVVFIALVLTAQNGILFLVAWEMMAMSAFFLVIFDGHVPQVRRAGFLYLAATHMGTLCLFVAFVLLGMNAGSFDFDRIAGSPAIVPAGAAVFVLSVIGFGGKAGFMPLHIWLPEAHPAAPSPVSALMSGVMIKTGIYGILRILSFFQITPAWWGYTLGAVGLVSGCLGIIWALAQSDFKRLLAYSSIENIGIITIGLGLGYLGLSFGNPMLILFGFGGALFHVINHGLFKSLLFLGAGSVLHATGNRDIDRQGGLLKRMPLTGLAILLGSVAICGLPPLNGFISEWLIYLGAFHVIQGKDVTPLFGAPILALIGTLAVACFTKAFGMQFLGSPRSREAADAKESDVFMTGAMAVLGLGCCLIGFFPGAVLPAVERALSVLVPVSLGNLNGGSPGPLVAQAPVLLGINQLALGLAAAVFVLYLVRKALISRRTAAESTTWGCGYAVVNSRMQYTSSSYAQFPVSLFQKLLRPLCAISRPRGYFPEPQARFASRTPDLVWDRFLLPLIRRGQAWFLTVRGFQHGRVQLYLVYMFLFLVVLFLWKL
ncbi:MAG TPA: proton-conducting transporter membrane subunit [bacterium]|nr:proton-conducting transporter membrane subunit [bacterium]